MSPPTDSTNATDPLNDLAATLYAVALAQLTALAVEDGSGEGVAAFGAVELGEDAAAVGLVVEVGE